MPRILHASDLHLCESEREYGLAVLSELLDLARREGARLLLFSGDLFDTWPDAERLTSDVRRAVEALPAAERPEFLYLPGNHEALRRGSGELGRLDLGPVTVLDAAPFSLLRREPDGVPVEILAIPHQEHYAGYGNWSVPPKSAPWRLALAHGVVAGMAFGGLDGEGGATALDPDLFVRLGVDYAALGHIHGRRHQAFGSTVIAYPGSARVWRQGETGPRGAYLVDLPDRAAGAAGRGPEPAFVRLAAAGEYRRYGLPLTLEGGLPDLDRLATEWGPKDAIELELTGLVEDGRQVARLAEDLQARHGGRVRSLTVTRDGVTALPGISSHPVARQFLELWAARPEARDPGHPGHAAWLRARELALLQLKASLGRAAATVPSAAASVPTAASGKGTSP